MPTLTRVPKGLPKEILLPVITPPASSATDSRTAIVSGAGEERTLAILFADIESYTAFTEKFSPFDVMHMLKVYFSHANEVVTAHRGIVSDYFGDGLMAFFGIESPGTAAADAVTAGFALFRAVNALNAHLELLYGKGIRIRVGIDYGPVVVGKVRMNAGEKLVVIGDHVNTASRIESLNKELGTQFLVSENVLRALPDRLVTGGTFTAILKGKSRPVKLLEAVALQPESTSPTATS